MADWSNWIGREERATDLLDTAFAKRWLATFDRKKQPAGAMPQGIHFCLCTPDAQTQDLGSDGHPVRRNDPATILPPIPLPRRMWASSAITFLRPLKVAEQVERRSTTVSISEKNGTSGKLAFVDVEHLWLASGGEAIRETQTLVYREAAAENASLLPPEPGQAEFDADAWDAATTLTPSKTLLFRYSALTFNTHRIHYDLPYARDVERYRGLVVHGPLIASLLMKLVADTHGENALASFTFRAISPAIAGDRLHLVMRQNGSALELGALADDGRQTLKANATLA